MQFEALLDENTLAELDEGTLAELNEGSQLGTSEELFPL
jgi:hypothetical protein